mgnify:CR=1 FL=1|jgi:hypothetical protein
MKICEFIDEELINRGLDSWQIRSDDQRLIGDDIKVILKDVMVRTDRNAFKANEKLFAFLRGAITKEIPNLNSMHSFPVWYKRDLDAPFFNAKTKEPFITADFVVFGMDGSVTAYIK